MIHDKCVKVGGIRFGLRGTGQRLPQSPNRKGLCENPNRERLGMLHYSLSTGTLGLVAK